MSLKVALTKCIRLVEEDLRRWEEAQKSTHKAFGPSESTTLKNYLTALSGAYRNAQEVDDIHPELETSSTEDIEQELRNRIKEEESND